MRTNELLEFTFKGVGLLLQSIMVESSYHTVALCFCKCSLPQSLKGPHIMRVCYLVPLSGVSLSDGLLAGGYDMGE